MFQKILIGCIVVAGLITAANALQVGPSDVTIECTVLDSQGFYNGNATLWLLECDTTKSYWIKPSWLSAGEPSDHKVSVEGAGKWNPHLLGGTGYFRTFTVYGMSKANQPKDFTLNVYEDDGDGVFEPGPSGDDSYDAFSFGTLTTR